MIDFAVLNVGNLTSSIVAGLLVGVYTNWIFGRAWSVTLRQRAFLAGWYWGFGVSILYIARIAFGVYRETTDETFTSDLPRLMAGWLLFLVFAAFVTFGAYAAGRLAIVRAKRRLKAPASE